MSHHHHHGHHHHHRHHHGHHHGHHHSNDLHPQGNILTLLKQHRSDSRWRRDQSTNDLGDQHAANQIEAEIIADRSATVAGPGKASAVGDAASGDGDKLRPKKSAHGSSRRRRQSQADMMVVKPRMLAKVDLCRGLGTAAMAHLAASFIVRPFRRGHIFTSEGQVSALMFVLLSGRISVQIKSVEVATLDPISVFGERAVMLGTNASATCISTEPAVVGTLSREAFNLAVGHDLAFELETMTRLRAVVQDSKNEQNYTIAHASSQEKELMAGVGLITNRLRIKVSRNRLKHLRRQRSARKHWDSARAFALALMLKRIHCLAGLTWRHYMMLGFRCHKNVRKYSCGDYLYKSSESNSDGVFILLKGKVSLIAPKSAFPPKRARSSITRTLAFLSSGDCVGDIELLSQWGHSPASIRGANYLEDDKKHISYSEELKRIRALPRRALSAKVVLSAIALFIPASEFFWLKEESMRLARGEGVGEATDELADTSTLNIPESWAIEQKKREVEWSKKYRRTKVESVKQKGDEAAGTDVAVIADGGSIVAPLLFPLPRNFNICVRAARQASSGGNSIDMNSFLGCALRIMDGQHEYSLGRVFGASLPLLREIAKFSSIEPTCLVRVCTGMRCRKMPPRTEFKVDGKVLIIARGMAEIDLMSTENGPRNGHRFASYVTTAGRCFGIEEWQQKAHSRDHHHHGGQPTPAKEEQEEQEDSMVASAYRQKMRTATTCHILQMKFEHFSLVPTIILKNIKDDVVQHRRREHKVVSHLLDREHTEGRGYGFQSRFGLLMPEVSSATVLTGDARAKPDNIKEIAKRKAVKEAKPESAVSEVRRNLYGKDPTVAVDAKKFAACKSVYRSEDPLGDPSELYEFANFASPPKGSQRAVAESCGSRGGAAGRGNKQLPAAPSGYRSNRKTSSLLRRPCPVVSVTSLSTRKYTVHRFQPVSMQMPLPVATRPLTKKLHRGTYVSSRRQIKDQRRY